MYVFINVYFKIIIVKLTKQIQLNYVHVAVQLTNQSLACVTKDDSLCDCKCIKQFI